MNSSTESALRKRAAARGYILRKSRVRHPDLIAAGYDGYQLSDLNNCLVLGDRNSGFGCDLEEIAEFLKDEEV